jgi:hypothetical protein
MVQGTRRIQPGFEVHAVELSGKGSAVK